MPAGIALGAGLLSIVNVVPSVLIEAILVPAATLVPETGRPTTRPTVLATVTVLLPLPLDRCDVAKRAVFGVVGALVN